MYWGIGGFLLTPFLGKVGFGKVGDFKLELQTKSKLLLRVNILKKYL
jgi:hypothetical protein